jgi:hypothetical protein
VLPSDEKENAPSEKKLKVQLAPLSSEVDMPVVSAANNLVPARPKELTPVKGKLLDHIPWGSVIRRSPNEIVLRDNDRVVTDDGFACICNDGRNYQPGITVIGWSCDATVIWKCRERRPNSGTLDCKGMDYVSR